MRWIFILLLLVNAVYFYWQLRLPENPSVAKAVPADVARLRLLSEVDRSLLLSRKSSLQEVKERQDEYEVPVVPSWCQVIGGISSLGVAEEIRAKLLLNGIESSLVVDNEDRVLAFELIVRQPSAGDADKALLANIKAMELAAELITLNGGPAYVLGRYGARAEVNRAQQRLEGLLRSEVYQVVSKDGLYQVWVELESGSETSNKINELQEYFQRGIKIEKKVCKGVASTGERD